MIFKRKYNRRVLPAVALLFFGPAFSLQSAAMANTVLTIQAENASQTTGSGWSTESQLGGFTGSGYIVWRGADDFRTSDAQPPAGIKAYDFQVTQAGTYEFVARVQARVGNGTAANDKDNDAWVKFTSGSATSGVEGDAAKWTKFFVSGSDESWKNYTRGEQYGPTFFTDIQRDLTVGTHRILIGGRSARFAIDSVSLELLSSSGAVGEPDPVIVPVSTPTEPMANVCTATGATLSSAKSAYADSCPNIPRQDCDPIGGGGWMCSSGVIGASAPGVTATPSNPATPSIPVDIPPSEAPSAPETPSEPETPEMPSTPVAGESCTATGSSLTQAKQNYASSCAPIPRQDCDPVRGGGWMCSSGVIGASAPGVTATPSTPTTTPSTPTTTPSTPVETPSSPEGGTVGRIDARDLLSLHYDNCPDRDDGHALVAGKAVIDEVGLQNVLVVNGTCGANIRNRYQPESVAVLDAVWGNDWLDYFNQQTLSVNTAADRWAATLANGDDVWVAEGGPSDFTAGVLRRLDAIYPSVDRKRIHVVQHSAGSSFNEANTLSANISLVKQVADYIAIPDGNARNNGNADLNQKSSSFVSIALQSRYASEWEVAFDYLSPDTKLDFSDTVELLYIIDDTQTLTVDDFADRYLR